MLKVLLHARGDSIALSRKNVLQASGACGLLSEHTECMRYEGCFMMLSVCLDHGMGMNRDCSMVAAIASLCIVPVSFACALVLHLADSDW